MPDTCEHSGISRIFAISIGTGSLLEVKRNPRGQVTHAADSIERASFLGVPHCPFHLTDNVRELMS